MFNQKRFHPIETAAALAAFKGSTKLIGKAISSSFPAPEPPHHGSRPGGTYTYLNYLLMEFVPTNFCGKSIQGILKIDISLETSLKCSQKD